MARPRAPVDSPPPTGVPHRPLGGQTGVPHRPLASQTGVPHRPLVPGPGSRAPTLSCKARWRVRGSAAHWIYIIYLFICEHIYIYTRIKARAKARAFHSSWGTSPPKPPKHPKVSKQNLLNSFFSKKEKCGGCFVVGHVLGPMHYSLVQYLIIGSI